MTSDVVLRQSSLHGAPAAIGRLRGTQTVPAPAVAASDPVAAASEAAYAQGFAEGRMAGFQRGHGEGLKRAAAEGAIEACAAQAKAVTESTALLDDRLRQLDAVLLAAAAALDHAVAAAQDDMVALCFETIARVLGPSLASAEGVHAQVAQLMQQSCIGRVLSVHVHPTVADAFRGMSTATSGRPQVVPDPAVELGGCIVQTSRGALDARLETILLEISAALAAERAG